MRTDSTTQYDLARLSRDELLRLFQDRYLAFYVSPRDLAHARWSVAADAAKAAMERTIEACRAMQAVRPAGSPAWVNAFRTYERCADADERARARADALYRVLEAMR